MDKETIKAIKLIKSKTRESCAMCPIEEFCDDINPYGTGLSPCNWEPEIYEKIIDGNKNKTR